MQDNLELVFGIYKKSKDQMVASTQGPMSFPAFYRRFIDRKHNQTITKFLWVDLKVSWDQTPKHFKPS